MDKKWYRKSKFLGGVVAALAAAGVLTASQVETVKQVIQAISGG